MKQLIQQALEQAYETLLKQVPKGKTETKSIDISDVSPFDLASFLQSNNVPENAWFDGKNNGHDAWDIGTTYVTWCIRIPLNDEDILKFYRSRFSNIAFKFVYDTLTVKGYIRKGFNSDKLKDFKDTTVYDMFINGKFDRLVEYYSLSFILPDL